MKAFTLWQPYADLVADGLKTVETRHYSFVNRPGHPQFGERFAIHAAKRKPTRADWAAAGYPYLLSLYEQNAGLRLGMIVATAMCVESIPMLEAGDSAQHCDKWVLVTPVGLRVTKRIGGEPKFTGEHFDAQRAYGIWGSKRHAWLLDDVQPLVEPVEAKGYQGWWNWDEETGAE